ncbi:MAG TPA: aldose 1-epimerase family protein [Solirubrobacteraceae bacterium]|nr:aldose 1-epimerase family protein [Solirubrobacteraceae bacterium]
MPAHPSGEQFDITDGEQRATIVEVGGGVREYAVGGSAVLDPYPLDAICDGAHGAPLIPWPNRVADGRYSFDGADHRLALSEPETLNAIHGLLRWRNWGAIERSADWVVVATRLHPLPSWPFQLDVSIRYSLGDAGLTVETQVTNVGDGTAPFGAGQHPYLSAGGGSIDACTVELRAGTRILTDPSRGLPVGSEPVAGTPFDLRVPRRVGELEIDHAFTELERDREGLAWVRLQRPDGATAELWADGSYPYIQLYTGDTLAPARRRLSLAAEPMTCPANALQSGEGIVRLAPGETHAGRWGVRLR